MTHALIEAAERLEATLLAENAALEALDFAAATALLGQKEAASLAFSQAQAQTQTKAAGGATEPALRARAVELGQSLQALVEANRSLLERAITVQARVIGIVTGAARQAMPAPGYGMRGRPAAGGRAAAYALVARA